MKKSIIVLSLLVIATLSSFAQNEKYISIMETTIPKLDIDKIEDIQNAANTFERIASMESTEWLPNYYASYAYMRMAVYYMSESDPEKMVASIEKAQGFLDKAKAIESENSEIYTLQGYIYQGHIWESPMINGALYSGKCYEQLEKAIALNPDNPRPHYIKGQNLFYTPSFFGGGPENAKPSLESADEKYATFKPASSIHPTWGARQNKHLLDKAVASK